MTSELSDSSQISSETATDDWVDIVTKTTEERWNTDGKALLLSFIPSMLRAAGIEMRVALQGRSLKSAIEIEAKNAVRLVKNPKHPLVWGLVPKTVPESEDLGPAFGFDISSQSAAAPRYKRWFWAAFVKELSPDNIRSITDDGFFDVPTTESTSINGIVLTDEDIVGATANTPVDPVVVLQAIEKWAKKTGQSLEEYQGGISLSEQKQTPSTRTPQISALINFELLDYTDLQRIMVPLDVVLKMVRRK